MSVWHSVELCRDFDYFCPVHHDRKACVERDKFAHALRQPIDE